MRSAPLLAFLPVPQQPAEAVKLWLITPVFANGKGALEKSMLRLLARGRASEEGQRGSW